MEIIGEGERMKEIGKVDKGRKDGIYVLRE